MKKKTNFVMVFMYILLYIIGTGGCQKQKTSFSDQLLAIPSSDELNRPFGKHDEQAFRLPSKVYYPETWFHFIGGNVAIKGITADLEAIAGAKISGIQLFHEHLGGSWPGVTPQITILSELWDDVVQYTAKECQRLGLRFTMQNCPGWAMSGGPWIEPSNAMRHLVWSRTDVESNTNMIHTTLAQPQPSRETWRDYQDITVLAFPTPLDDTGEPLKPQSVKTNRPELSWKDCLAGNPEGRISLPPSNEQDPNWVEVTFPNATTVRTVEFSSINGFLHAMCYEPGVTVTVQAILPNGTTQVLLHTDMPMASWQDDQPISLSCPEMNDVRTYRISIANKYNMALSSLRLFSAARKHNWESEAGWTLRSIVREGDNPLQSPESFIDQSQIQDITTMMDEQGNLKWIAPFSCKWTILRIGHVNTGMRNSPAPPEGTGWECNKLSETGPDAHFAGYIGRLSGQDGVLANGLLNGMLIDSWECKTQTWTNNMEAEFDRVSGYPLRQWLPAVFGYIVDNQETTTRFLRDWRATIGDLYANKYYGRMAKIAKDNGLTLQFETAAGDIFPADILEYFKHAEIPMCEFWHPFSVGYVGSLNFKPIKPTVSAARMYGKPRIAAEAFTSFNLTWDEHWSMLKEVANINCIEGVSHFVFQAYTHNPRTDFLPPGTSFGRNIGTPFLRGQTWWKHMPAFTTYLARCTYMFERGKPVSDVLWYLGDEINHKPDQEAHFPAGFKYDYCNPDVLLNRLSVQDGMICTPEGIRYRVIWIPDNPRMLPQTLEKLYALVCDGATVIGNAPRGLATLSDAVVAQQRFDVAVAGIWGKTSGRNIRQIGKGAVVSGMTLDEALNELEMKPDVTGGNALWNHRNIDGADWYYVCAPKGGSFSGTLDFRNHGNVEIWDPLSGTMEFAETRRSGDRTLVRLDLPQAGSCFVVFRKKGWSSTVAKNINPNKTSHPIALATPWTLAFPDGWGAPSSLQIAELKAWKDLDVSDEAKAFSGTVTYSTTFDAGEIKKGKRFLLDLGRVDMIAAVSLNDKAVRTLWTPPYRVDLTGTVKSGVNTLTVEVTGTWFNRLVYDAGQLEKNRKTWTINGPVPDMALIESGLLGPIVLTIQENM